ncbi:hypothetical protein [Corynebacterium glutamicum]|uniref:Uncharacterized protein n=1 Tax=Corynebacterium glutamicum (strain R) TaxID=340322 RepID=A0AB72VFM5_CORGB|nr:hypothetical protein [Corynebacterium glutamicum]BAQ21179.1 hypothetical protein cgR_6117 [Corynebacterium glutamicum R]
MANPAELLHTQLSEWRKTGSLKTTRNLPSEVGWSDMRFAVTNLQNCIDLLNKMEANGQQITAWTSYIESWNRAVFGLDVPWSGSSGANGGVDEHALNSLLSLSAFLDLYVPKLNEGGLDSLRDMLDSDILNKPAQDYPFELKAYLARVRNHLEWCIENFDKLGEFELHEAAMQFRMTVLFMASSAPNATEKNRWATFIKDKFVWPFTTSTMTTAPANWAASQLGELGQHLFELLP